MNEDILPMTNAPEASQGSGSIKAIEDLCEQLADIRFKIDMKKVELDKIKEAEADLETRVLAFLEENDLTSYKGKAGTVMSVTRSSVKIPTGSDREEFFRYLREKGLYDEVVTVNSAWLNSYFKKEHEAAIDAGELPPAIPGLTQIKSSPVLSFRKGKA